MGRFGGYNQFEMTSHERTLIQAQADAIRDALNPQQVPIYDNAEGAAHAIKAIAIYENLYNEAVDAAKNYIKPLLPKTREQALDHINAINATGTYPDYIVSDKVRNAYMWLIRHLMNGKSHDAHLNYNLTIKYYVAEVTKKELRDLLKEDVHATIALRILGGDPKYYQGAYGDLVREQNDKEVW